MYAVLKTGGKQYKVEKGDLIDVEKLDGDVGSTVELAEVLMTGGEGDPEVGTPLLEGKKVEAKIVSQGKGEKIIILKHRRRKDSRVKTGHRQSLTTLEITSVG